MSLRRLVEAFNSVDVLPIEIPEIRDVIVSMGIQDQITFVGTDADDGQLFGIYYQFTRHSTPYALPEFHSLIVYNSRLSQEWTRLVCCKELIHIYDRPAIRTYKPEEVDQLIEKVLGPLATEDFGLGDIMASLDKLAVYQALAILFPRAARTQALDLLAEGKVTIDEIAMHASLPLALVTLALSDEWLPLVDVILDL